MTEQEWLTCRDARLMLEHLLGSQWFQARHDLASDRKLRLFACGCMRLPEVWSLLSEPESRAAIEVAEDLADGKVRYEDIEALIDTTFKASACLRGEACFAADEAAMCLQPGDGDLAARYKAKDPTLIPLDIQARLLREIFGNVLNPHVHWWPCPPAEQMALAAYRDRDFSALPIIADALEEAGCDNSEMLAHLRDTEAPHVKGCWALDLVLGKS